MIYYPVLKDEHILVVLTVYPIFKVYSPIDFHNETKLSLKEVVNSCNVLYNGGEFKLLRITQHKD